MLLLIKDNGHGIANDSLARIFDPFYTKTKSGTGLGLYVTNGILKRFGAEILVRSRVDVGSCFFIWFYENPTEQFGSNMQAISNSKM